MKKGFLHELLRAKQTVFSFKELMLLWGGIDSKTARARVHYYVKSGHLYHVRRGLYAKNQDYNKFELAARIFTPSYISLETVLSRSGIVFQHYDQIFAVTYQSKQVACDGSVITFKRIKEQILTNLAGIEQRESYAIATPERAFLDVLYLNKDYHFDNLSSLDWDNVFALLPVYGGNRRMEKTIREYRKAMGNNH